MRQKFKPESSRDGSELQREWPRGVFGARHCRQCFDSPTQATRAAPRLNRADDQSKPRAPSLQWLLPVHDWSDR
eukprot:9087467-Pyramimonas_sp.AAC.1